jgi:hypothetical protein
MEDWQVVALAFLALPLWWSVILKFASVLGPWSQLAARYPEDRVIEGRDYRWNSLGLGLCNYGHCILARASDDYLKLRPMFPVHWHHPPIVLPRSALVDVRPGRVLWMKCVRFRVDGHELTLSGPVIADRFFVQQTPATLRDSL